MDSSLYLESLNEKQREAVLTTDGPLLILAGAGAGKTKTLTHRIYHLIKTGVDPESILAITFTNKAAGELRERINKLLEGDTTLNGKLPLAKTFHSLSVLILREHHALLGLPRFFSIFDRGDSLSAVKDAMKKVSVGQEIKPTQALSFISSKKSDAVSVDEFESEAMGQYRLQDYASIWREYENILKQEKALDFDDLLFKTVALLNDHEKVREHYRKRWSHLHIDEYQDTNTIQYRLSQLLIGPEEHICVVGDADQTIYMWRGANIQNILNFERDYKNAKVVLLEQNYRSTKTILQAANDCIKKNTMRKEKNLFTDNEDGELIALSSYVTEEDESEGIAGSIEGLIDKGVKKSEIGILYRANFQSRVLEESLVRHGIPYRLLGTKFFDRKEVKDVISYIRAAFNRESATDLLRAASFPKRGLGSSTVEKIARGESALLSKAARDKANSFLELLDLIKDKAEKERPKDVVAYVISASGIEDELSRMGEEGEERLQNVQELVSLAASFDDTPGVDGIEKLLESAALTTDADEDGNEDGIRLMTVHAAKGLEFEHVFVTGLEEGLFPQKKERTTKAEEEEERRLFYVAITRARKQLNLSYALSRRIWGSRVYAPPSDFVSEMDPCLIQTKSMYEDAPRKRGYLDDIEF